MIKPARISIKRITHHNRQIILEVICFLFILLFVYASVIKLLDVEKFRIQIGQSPMLTDFADLVAWGIPITELLIALMLAIPRLRLVGLFAAFSLMVMFTGYIITILQFSEKIPCSCGGVLESMGWTEHLIFNIVFIILGIAGVLLYSQIQQNKFQAMA